MNNSLQHTYDQLAATYDANRGLFDVSEIFNDFYQRLSSKRSISDDELNGDLLDLGCGAGEPFARWFLDRGWRVTGVDFSEKMLELARRYTPEMQALHADMREVEFAPQSFDAIIAVYSLFHIPRADQPRLLQNFARWLRPNGLALFTYATQEYSGQPVFEGTKEFMGQSLFYSHTTPDELFATIEESGLKVEAAQYREIGGETFLWMTVSKA